MIVSFADFLKKYCPHEKHIAVGVSGGSDSLALVLAAFHELSPLGYKITALTVDHGLRPTSAQEAAYVGQVMQKFGIGHYTLCWQGQKPQTGVEEAARKARYDLMSQWCAQHHVRALMLAHQQEDQAETFLMRLQRGSGLDGLCGMQACTRRGSLLLLRPLLHTSKEELRTYLKEQNIHWVEDETNLSADFFRGRLRTFMPEFCRATGITVETLCQTTERLQQASALLKRQTNDMIDRYFRLWTSVGCCCPLETWKNFDIEIRFRLLQKLLPIFGQTEYPPRAARMMRLIEALDLTDFKGATLGGCTIVCFHGFLWIVRTVKAKGYTCEAWKKYVATLNSDTLCDFPYPMRVALVKNAENLTD